MYLSYWIHWKWDSVLWVTVGGVLEWLVTVVVILLMLQELQNLTDSGQYRLDTFISLVYQYGLERLLDRGGIFTIFVPTDEAFDISMVTK